MTKTYTFFTDPGHGWLAVPRQEIDDLGIADEITPFSYQKNNMVYLEEDCDAYTFIKTYRDRYNQEPQEETVYHDVRSWIRRCEAYRPTGKTDTWIKDYAEQRKLEYRKA